ncbi:TrlF family AAA-like ATPase [uncultured Polaribacter sp.]|uniref:TrlF family AAA-like ATPase n=1 Tax=uncultured Polaribacter sp. TaxID=174711 RepID=UPI002632197E|nr:AAA family ATPase [uncultured Polaribacter sp.]
MKKEEKNTIKKHPKGAEWRKWDLHVHTPASIYQRFGADNEETWETYISDLENLPNDYAVLGINDYLFLDGYTKLKEEQTANNRLQNIKLLPVVEFRIEKFAGVDFKNLKRINLHVIFSDEVTIETIKSQFLNTLEQSYSIVNGEKWTRAITKESVSELGAEIKKSVAPEELKHYGSDLDEGFNNLNIDEKQIFKSLNKDCFKDKFIIAIGKTEWADLKWTDASIATKKSIINEADIVFTASKSIEAYNNAKAQLTNQKVNDLLLDCSDAHYLSSSTDKDRIGNCYTWIKADPNFEGLKQVLNEPKERIFIGEIPLIKNRVSTNKTKYIKSLSLKPISGYGGGYGKWFNDVDIPLNPELVAIIGNKGSGKSAIADIIGLCGNAKIKADDFSFLNKKKFRSGGDKISKNFEATLLWESDVTSTKTLNSEIGEDIQMVKYLPQGYFERLTNEISTIKEFQDEIENVVFTHINIDDKGSFTSFDELIRHKKNISNQEIDLIKQELKLVNQEIINLEKKRNSKYKEKIENNIKLKKDELEALNEPKVVSNPDSDPNNVSENKIILDKIGKINEQSQKIADSILKNVEQKKVLIDELDELNITKEDVQFRKREFDDFKIQKEPILLKYGLSFNTIFKLELKLDSLNNLINAKEKEFSTLKINLGEEDSKDPNFKSLKAKLETLSKELKIEQSKLDGPQKAYQIYLTKKKEWENKKGEIIGSDDKVNTLKFFEKELLFLTDNLLDKLSELKIKRNEISSKIFDKKQAIISIYKKIKSDIDSIIKDNTSLVEDYKININAALTLKPSFNDKFFSFINQNVLGTFYNKENGQLQLNKIYNGTDFDKKEEVIEFLNNLVDAISFDKRSDQKNTDRYIDEQLKDANELYDYLFSLDFLDYNYQLKQGDKTLEQLSPGEKGALLLVFYLLLDKEDIPLIIDQPEDNLDNHSVANILVPFIKIAKNNRQIIMVTHNPNLAVVSDAEQIIYVNLDKENDLEFKAISGSIENREINDSIVRVLEGAMPAFNKRKQKYYEPK